MLTDVSLAYNSLIGGSPNMFDDCKALRHVNIHGNRLHCRVFEFHNCTSLQTIRASGNRLTGGLPASWGSTLQHLQVLDLSHNQLGGPGELSQLATLVELENLSTLDLSHNAFEYVRTPSCTMSCEFSEWMRGWLGVSLRFVDLSHNRLRSPLNLTRSNMIGPGEKAASNPNLVSLKMHHNELTGLVDLMGLGFNFDFSHNNLSGISVRSWGIQQTGTMLQHVDFTMMNMANQRRPFWALTPADSKQRFGMQNMLWQSIDEALDAYDF